MKVVAIVQARMGSTRLPGKVMKPFAGKPLIQVLFERLSKAQSIDEIILATSNNFENDQLAAFVSELGFSVYRGSEKDVLGRFYEAALQSKADVVVRITGDCPLIEPDVVDMIVNTFSKSKPDIACNTQPATFPDGLDASVFSFETLKEAHLNATSELDREHVTRYIYQKPGIRVQNLTSDQDYSKLRWTVDEPADYEVIKSVFSYFHPRLDFTWREVLSLHQDQPALFMKNQNIQRNEGTNLATGQKLWKRAKDVIPGGNMLLSKRSEMFLPEFWPSYYSKAKGCTVWDMDGKEFIDMSIMGIGTNILGYGNEEVDDAVRQTVANGNMSTLNCPEEVYLAEKLIEMHPWADMARFARSGGEANSIAIRIARAATGKHKVAFCGYHGWHDWYLASNLSKGEGLSSHLLPGLEPNGVPPDLKDTVFPFNYNDYNALEEIVRKEEIGVIKMEVMRNHLPENNFLERVRKLADDNGIVLIFDECTSGFRQTFGGIHTLFGVEPDMAMFGKALGNGYAITGVIGKRDIMQAAQSTFISSTFWTERIGPTAALKTLEVMKREKSWEQITETGKYIAKSWEEIGQKLDLPIESFGIPSLMKFRIASKDMLKYKTYITQEMLKKGYLAGNSVYVCTEHTKEVVDEYLQTIEPIFATIKECEEGRDIDSLLEGPVCHSEFNRLN